MLDGITGAICRPPRAQYSVTDLGPPRVRYRGVEYKRKDFCVRNSRGLAVKGSVWELINPRLGDSDSCILYLHPNSGSRVDVVKTRIMSIAAAAKCTVCGFDFAGCGSSEGDNVSLGVREKEDICAVMSFLLTRGCKRFVLWGRSMGAASAAMFFGAYKETLRGTVVALILDSPFTSMQGLASEYTSSTKIPVPGLLLSPALHVLRQNILSKYGFDILYISPIAAASRITIPTVVLSGSEDKIVPPSLSESIYEALNGPKLRIFFKGGHNTHRPTVVFDAIRVVLTGALRGLRADEYLHLAEAVITNHCATSHSPAISTSSSSPQQGKKLPSPSTSSTIDDDPKRNDVGGIAGKGQSEDSVAAKISAQHQEELVHNMLQQKGVNALTGADIAQVIGERKKTTGLVASNLSTELPVTTPPLANVDSVKNSKVAVEKSINPSASTATNGAKISNSDKLAQAGEMKDLICSVQLDVCQDVCHTGGLSFGSSWSESVGSFIWGGRVDHQGSAPLLGSLGYLRQYLASDVCPPDAHAWEELLVAQATSWIVDAAIEQTISLVTGFEDARMVALSEHVDMSEADAELMMSMIVAQVTSEMDLVFVREQESASWDSLLMKSLCGLQEISRGGGGSYENSEGMTIINESNSDVNSKPTN